MELNMLEAMLWDMKFFEVLPKLRQITSGSNEQVRVRFINFLKEKKTPRADKVEFVLLFKKQPDGTTALQHFTATLFRLSANGNQMKCTHPFQVEGGKKPPGKYEAYATLLKLYPYMRRRQQEPFNQRPRIFISRAGRRGH